ncbi:MAG: enoyl-CoA hydratase family protein [Acidimicrobiales bacterium]
MPLTPKSFLYAHDRDSAVATITLNRPERLNALTFEVYTELRDTFRALDTEPGVRSVIITGAGRAFCSGGDVEDIIGALLGRDPARLLEFTRLTCDLILAMRRCRRPIVGALNGTVAGAGAVIATACDVRIAAESAKIAFLFTRVGLSGADMGAAWLLPRLVGLGRATELLLTGSFIDAPTAHEYGLYQRVVPAERVVAEATTLAAQLARGPSEALGATKHAIDLEATLDLEAALAHEAEVQAVLMRHPNFREAYEGFRARREPRFT